MTLLKAPAAASAAKQALRMENEWPFGWKGEMFEELLVLLEPLLRDPPTYRI
jgi:hypothetical protein